MHSLPIPVALLVLSIFFSSCATKNAATKFSASATESAYFNDGTILNRLIAETKSQGNVEKIYKLAIPYKDRMSIYPEAHAIFLEIDNGKKTLLLVAGVTNTSAFITEKSLKNQFAVDFRKMIDLMDRSK